MVVHLYMHAEVRVFPVSFPSGPGHDRYRNPLEMITVDEFGNVFELEP